MKILNNILKSLSVLCFGIGSILIYTKPNHAIVFIASAIYLLLMSKEK